jgi:hypothetical protein
MSTLCTPQAHRARHEHSAQMALGYALAYYTFLFKDHVGSDAVAAGCFFCLEGATHSEDARLQITVKMGSGAASGFRRRIHCRRWPDWWREVAYAGTKLLYQPAPQPVVYIVPVTDILGRLALVPYGETETIPYDWRGLARFYPKGECDRQDAPGSGSKLCSRGSG